MIDLSCCNVDLLANQHEARSILHCQRHELLRHGRKCYFHIARLNLQHTILPLANSERITRQCLCRCRSGVLDTHCCSHLIAAARYIDCRNHRCSRRSRRRHRLARRLRTWLRYKLSLMINYNIILQPLLCHQPIENDLSNANCVVTNIDQHNLL